MRTEKALKNSVISVLSQIVILILAFINRKIFLLFLDINYLGYESLFTNIFNLLNITELGIGGIITFHLYKELADNNTKEISKLMTLYKQIYRVIAVIVLLLGVMIFFVLPLIITDNITDWNYVRLIYIIQLIGTVANFVLVCNRTIFTADQKEYKVVTIDLVSKIIIQILQIIMIVCFKSFILYLICKSVSTIIANFIIWILRRKEYKYIDNKIKVQREDIKKWNIVSDVKNFIIHKIAYVIYSGTDNIVISAFCGIKNVALYGNYYIIQTNVMNLIIGKMLNPIQATIGDYVYSCKDLSKQQENFNMLDMFGIILASYVTIGFLVFFQPAINLWLGEEYILGYGFVITYCIITYLSVSFEILYKYRSAFGDYNKDRNYMISAAVLNIFFSIVLSKIFGMVGINIGTILGLIPIIYGRIKFVFLNFLQLNPREYIFKHIKYALVDIIQATVIVTICYFIPNSIIGLLFKFIFYVVVVTLVNYLHYSRKKEFKIMFDYLKELLNKIKIKTLSKLKRNGKEN